VKSSDTHPVALLSSETHPVALLSSDTHPVALIVFIAAIPYPLTNHMVVLQ
jgi:uncharacterized paraquat-inducible protein A